MTMLEEYFCNVYANCLWGPGSGVGSIPKNTVHYRRVLKTLLTELGIRTVLDIGCGDWQLGNLVPWGDIGYTGIDIVPDLVAANQERYGSPRRRFMHGNALEMALPPADLLILKDVMQHWLPEEILHFLPQLDRYRYSLITNDGHESKEPPKWYQRWRSVKPLEWHDRWHPIVLDEPPYNFRPGRIVLVDHLRRTYPPKITTLYERLGGLGSNGAQAGENKGS